MFHIASDIVNIMIICILIFTWWSIEQIKWVFATKQKSLVLLIDMWVVYLAFVVGGFFALIHTFSSLYCYSQKYLQSLKEVIR